MGLWDETNWEQKTKLLYNMRLGSLTLILVLKVNINRYFMMTSFKILLYDKDNAWALN